MRHSRLSRREFIEKAGWGAAMMAGTGLIDACASGNQAPSSVTPKKGGNLIMGYATDIASLNPILAVEASNLGITRLLFDPLLNFDDNENAVPLVAESAPRVSSDQLTYTFPVRKNIKWSDGRPLTVDDIVWTYQLIYEPRYKDVAFPNRSQAALYIDSVSAPDDHTVVIKTKQVFAPSMLLYGNVPILPKHVLGNLSPKEFNTSEFNIGPNVVSGPFKFVKWEKGQQVTFARNDAYWRGPAYLDGFVYRVVSKPPNQLKTGEIDWGLLGAADLDQMRAGGNINILNIDSSLYYYAVYNLDTTKRASKLFGEKEVRQALYYAMNRQQAGDAIFQKTETIVDSIITKTSWAYSSNVKKYPHDKAKAEQLLDAAGWKKNAQGTREKAGVELKFEMIVDNFQPERANLVQAVQQQWKAIGVEMSPRVVAANEWISQLTTKRDFDAVLMLLVLGGNDPNPANLLASESAKPGGFNASHYGNPEVDGLLQQGLSTLDRGKRKQVYAKVQEIAAEELPVTPILSTGTLWGVNKRVKNLKIGPYTQFRNWYWIKDVWVTDGK